MIDRFHSHFLSSICLLHRAYGKNRMWMWWESISLHLQVFDGGCSLCTEKAMAPHSSTLAWKIPWMEEPGRLQSMGSLRVGYHFHFSLSCIGEGNGNPLQCSHLENPRDAGAWWAAVYGVTQSQTRLKVLSRSSITISDMTQYACRIRIALLFCSGSFPDTCSPSSTRK